MREWLPPAVPPVACAYKTGQAGRQREHSLRFHCLAFSLAFFSAFFLAPFSAATNRDNIRSVCCHSNNSSGSPSLLRFFSFCCFSFAAHPVNQQIKQAASCVTYQESTRYQILCLWRHRKMLLECQRRSEHFGMVAPHIKLYQVGPSRNTLYQILPHKRVNQMIPAADRAGEKKEGSESTQTEPAEPAWRAEPTQSKLN